MKLHLVAALLLTSVLAGCSSGGDDGAAGLAGALDAPTLYLNVTVGDQTYRYSTGAPSGATSSSASASATVSATATATSGTATASGNATGNATKATGAKAAPGNQTASGEAPLNVSVTLGAKGLPAGNAFTWTLDWGDGKAAGAASGNGTTTVSSTASATGAANTTGSAGAKANATKAGSDSGSKVPATVTHTYTAPGNHTIRFTLTPANGTAASVSTTIAVAAPANATGNQTAALPSGTVIGPAPMLDGEGSFVVGNPLCTEAGSFDWAIPLTDNATGTTIAVTKLAVTLTGSPSNVDSDLEVYGPDGELIDDSAGATATESVSADGPFPGGTFRVVVLSCAGVAAEFTVHGEATLVAA